MRHGRELSGPYTLPELQARAADGRLLPQMQLSCDKQNWLPAKQLGGLPFLPGAISSAADTTPEPPPAASAPPVTRLPAKPITKVGKTSNRLRVATPLIQPNDAAAATGGRPGETPVAPGGPLTDDPTESYATTATNAKSPEAADIADDDFSRHAARLDRRRRRHRGTGGRGVEFRHAWLGGFQ